ncbi:hypothetical protein LINPERPRIM_LOCUS4265 [Linum perenne]
MYTGTTISSAMKN